MNSTPTTLILETSSLTGSWALFENSQCVESDTFTGRASAALPGSLEKIRPRLHTINQIIVGVGPGSFSGIRVGIATAQGLACGLNCHVIPCRSSHALAKKYAHISKLGIFSDAKRQHLFFTGYENGHMGQPARLVPLAELEACLESCTLTISPDPLPPVPLAESPSAVDLGTAFFDLGPELDLPLEPIYLHTPVALKQT